MHDINASLPEHLEAEVKVKARRELLQELVAEIREMEFPDSKLAAWEIIGLLYRKANLEREQ